MLVCCLCWWGYILFAGIELGKVDSLQFISNVKARSDNTSEPRPLPVISETLPPRLQRLPWLSEREVCLVFLIKSTEAFRRMLSPFTSKSRMLRWWGAFCCYPLRILGDDVPSILIGANVSPKLKRQEERQNCVSDETCVHVTEKADIYVIDISVWINTFWKWREKKVPIWNLVLYNGRGRLANL